MSDHAEQIQAATWRPVQCVQRNIQPLYIPWLSGVNDVQIEGRDRGALKNCAHASDNHEIHMVLH
jgi:hypothetical protein